LRVRRGKPQQSPSEISRISLYTLERCRSNENLKWVRL